MKTLNYVALAIIFPIVSCTMENSDNVEEKIAKDAFNEIMTWVLDDNAIGHTCRHEINGYYDCVADISYNLQESTISFEYSAQRMKGETIAGYGTIPVAYTAEYSDTHKLTDLTIIETGEVGSIDGTDNYFPYIIKGKWGDESFSLKIGKSWSNVIFTINEPNGRKVDIIRVKSIEPLARILHNAICKYREATKTAPLFDEFDEIEFEEFPNSTRVPYEVCDLLSDIFPNDSSKTQIWMKDYAEHLTLEYFSYYSTSSDNKFDYADGMTLPSPVFYHTGNNEYMVQWQRSDGPHSKVLYILPVEDEWKIDMLRLGEGFRWERNTLYGRNIDYYHPFNFEDLGYNTKMCASSFCKETEQRIIESRANNSFPTTEVYRKLETDIDQQYIVSAVFGNCENSRTPVKISIVRSDSERIEEFDDEGIMEAENMSEAYDDASEDAEDANEIAGEIDEVSEPVALTSDSQSTIYLTLINNLYLNNENGELIGYISFSRNNERDIYDFEIKTYRELSFSGLYHVVE